MSERTDLLADLKEDGAPFLIRHETSNDDDPYDAAAADYTSKEVYCLVLGEEAAERYGAVLEAGEIMVMVADADLDSIREGDSIPRHEQPIGEAWTLMETTAGGWPGEGDAAGDEVRIYDMLRAVKAVREKGETVFHVVICRQSKRF